MSRSRAWLILGVMTAFSMTAFARQQSGFQTKFGIKYVAEGAVYLDGGRNAGLAEGQKLTVRRSDPDHPEGRVIAEIEVSSVASSSAACLIRSSNESIQAGDVAELSRQDTEVLRKVRAVEETRRYAQVITFTETNTLEQEARDMSRVRGYRRSIARGGASDSSNSAIRDADISRQTSAFGFVLRIDATRIFGTYWNLSGYYRGRFSRQSNSQETLSDLIQRTYHFYLSYNNPSSHWTAGIGRLYLPSATSLGTIDGGYFGRRFGRRLTLGMFGAAPRTRPRGATTATAS